MAVWRSVWPTVTFLIIKKKRNKNSSLKCEIYQDSLLITVYFWMFVFVTGRLNEPQSLATVLVQHKILWMLMKVMLHFKELLQFEFSTHNVCFFTSICLSGVIRNYQDSVSTHNMQWYNVTIYCVFPEHTIWNHSVFQTEHYYSHGLRSILLTIKLGSCVKHKKILKSWVLGLQTGLIFGWQTGHSNIQNTC